MQLFDIIPQDFFKPLAGSYRRQYMDVISMLWVQCKRRPLYGESRSIIFDWVEEYFYGLQGELQLDEQELEAGEDGDESLLTPRVLAGIFIRRLKATGWLEEREGGYEEEPSIVVNHRIVPLIRAFSDIVTPQMTTYKGKLFKIYKLLQSIADAESPYESVLREVSSDMDDLNTALRQLAASIGQYMDELTRGKTPEEILELFETYEEKVVVGAYHRFKTNDNLFYYKSELFEQLELCRTKYLVPLIQDCAAVEQLTEDDANSTILQLVSKIEDDLREMGEIMKVIDERHILYRSRAVQRAQFLLLADGTVKSKINRILQFCAETTTSAEDLSGWTDERISGLFQFYPQGFVSHRSLKPPIMPRKPTQIEELPELEAVDPEDFARRQEQLMQYVRNAVTAENVNHFAQTVLKDRQAATARQLVESYTAPEDLVKIIGLHTYSTSAERQYEISMKERIVSCKGLRFQDFTVTKRG